MTAPSSSDARLTGEQEAAAWVLGLFAGLPAAYFAGALLPSQLAELRRAVVFGLLWGFMLGTRAAAAAYLRGRPLLRTGILVTLSGALSSAFLYWLMDGSSWPKARQGTLLALAIPCGLAGLVFLPRRAWRGSALMLLGMALLLGLGAMSVEQQSISPWAWLAAALVLAGLMVLTRPGQRHPFERPAGRGGEERATPRAGSGL